MSDRQFQPVTIDARRRLLMLGAGTLPFSLWGCASLAGLQKLELTLAQLQQGLRSRLPLTGRYLEVFDIRLDNPRLSLAGNRLSVGLDASVRPTMLQTALTGSFGLSGVPRIDLPKRAVMLGQVQVDSLSVNGLNPVYSKQLARLGSSLAERFINDVPLYQFGPADFQMAGVRFQPTNINTTANSLVISFEPVR